ncbi:MAG: hypothetical protein ACTMUB_08455 [cyanobacterium endosymbiont of Rhopalodia musculus]|uniref:hypothetical protein n=1 Tax=cyanobacterium endosymbiont of Epithemia clementina EcSB TaxID=3034674 RepID=UPI00247FC543|nr:hypothetical protein [cyanobacterium endosymbiont of Epithemia clementina EcSB]WGT68106.1 hypothetical protein P3F56_03250 [cyanobacterium endosymbiont of Epithemia clementina EcSB]
MPSKTMQLFFALSLATIIGACSTPSEEDGKVQDSTQPTTEEITPGAEDAEGGED